MNRNDFRRLVDSLITRLQKDEAMGALRNGVIEPEIRVAVVIRMLSRASYLYIVLIRHIARSTVHQVFHYTSSILCASMQFFGFPEDVTSCTKLSMGFSKYRNRDNPLLVCIVPLDVSLIRIQKHTSYRRLGSSLLLL